MASESFNGPARPSPSRGNPEAARDPRRPDPSDPCAAVIERLAGRVVPFERYRIEGEIARGGMGRVLRVLDDDLRRHLAMKVLRGPEEGPPESPRSPSRSRQLARFLEEAQINGQLDHPGIVPVHELGLDPEGRVYFTMKLVRGSTLTQVIELVHAQRDGWSMVRAVGALLKVCEAMSYAHERHVIHRDLKPANIMVGRFGEVFVMDWGLARILDPGAELLRDAHERVTGIERGPSSELRSERHDVHVQPSDGDSPLVTLDGDVLGTPAYMSPEQASGRLERVGVQTDVYAVGAILYHVLCGSMPYLEGGARIDNYAIWRWLRKGPPTAVAELAPHASPELVAICEKAMERDLALRYATMQELADDLRAYLENRVVRAHRTGPVVELRKWIERNKLVASAAAALLLITVSAVALVAWKENQRANEVSQNLDEYLATNLVQRADALWPIHPERVPAMQAWLAQARAFVARAPAHERRLAELRASALTRGTAREVPAEHDHELEFAVSDASNRAKEMDAVLAKKRAAIDAGGLNDSELASARGAVDVLPREIDWWRSRAALLSARAAAPTSWVFDDVEGQSLNDRLVLLSKDARTLSTRAIPDVEARIELARALRRRTIEEPATAWQTAIGSIGNREQCPLYRGLVLAPQLGLVPLERDAHSGLWEFWHVLSGARPLRDERGQWRIDGETGIVLVLVPGGATWIGADKSDPKAANYDPLASITEKLQQIELAPFFAAKYELTQGQWLRATGEFPSASGPGAKALDSPRTTRAHPVESVSWDECTRVLTHWGLALPTEVQWEHAARAGTHTRYWSGDDFASLEGKVNFADAAYDRASSQTAQTGKSDDGYYSHAPVGSFASNAFGLHEVLGNVAEWCRDWYADSCDKTAPNGGDGLRDAAFSATKSLRGGGWRNKPDELRVSRRSHQGRSTSAPDLGLRAARAIDP